MGIRIHKAIGYGLNDVVADEENWDLRTDPRFDPEGYMFGDKERDFDLEGFDEYLEKRIVEMGKDDFDSHDLILLRHQIEHNDVEQLHHSVVYDMEFGSSNVILFMPPGYTHWRRYDDMIDYYDPANLSEDGGIAESVIKVNRPLFPYESYVNIKTMPPVHLTGFQQQLYVSMRNFGIDKYLDPEKSFNELGVISKEEYDEFIVPIIPPTLVELIKYLKVFKNEDDIYQLRPMIYGYWC